MLVYWFYSTGDVPNTFSANWGGNVIAGSELTDDTTVAGVYTRFVFTNLMATGPLTTLPFRATNDFGFWHLDDVSLSKLPEPSAIWLFGPVLASMLVLRRKWGRNTTGRGGDNRRPATVRERIRRTCTRRARAAAATGVFSS